MPIMTIPTIASARLKRYFAESGVRQTFFAKKAGVSYSALRTYLRGEHVPRPEVRATIAPIIGVADDAEWFTALVPGPALAAAPSAHGESGEGDEIGR